MSFLIPFKPKNFIRSEDQCSVSFKQEAGFNFSNYGRDDNPTIKAMMMVTTVSEGVPFGSDIEKTIFGFNWLANKDTTTTFSLSLDMQISELMYDPLVHKHEFLCQISIISMGRSSAKILATFSLEDYPDRPVITYVHSVVNVDAKSRRAIPWPSLMSDKFKARMQTMPFKNQTALKKTQRLSRPLNTFVHCVYVKWSDTDINVHCNFSNYPKFANDALQAALRLMDSSGMKVTVGGGGVKDPISSDSTERNINYSQGQGRDHLSADAINKPKTNSDQFVLYSGNPALALKGITREIVQWGVKDFSIHFFHECVEDDLLHVHIWQEEGNSHVVYSSIEKGDQVVVQLRLEYYTHCKSKL